MWPAIWTQITTCAWVPQRFNWVKHLKRIQQALPRSPARMQPYYARKAKDAYRGFFMRSMRHPNKARCFENPSLKSFYACGSEQTLIIDMFARSVL